MNSILISCILLKLPCLTSCPTCEMFVFFFLHCAGIKDKSILLHKLPATNFPSSLSKFDSQIIESWYNFYAVNTNGIQEILNEKLVYNKFILIGGKTISPNHVFIKYIFIKC